MRGGLGLSHVQVTDHPFIAMVFNQAGLAAGGARNLTRVVINGDADLLAGDIHIDAGNVPWGTPSKQGGQELLVSHLRSLRAA